MKTFLKLFLVLVFTINCVAQNMKFVDKGFLIYKSNDTINFTDLVLKGLDVKFHDDTHNKDEALNLSQILLIKSSTEKIIHQDINYKILDTKIISNATIIDEISNDNRYKPLYPSGIYVTKEEFINKKPSITTKVTPKGLYGFTKPTLTTIEHLCFFFNDADDKIKNVFAISYKGHLFFRIGAILDNRNKTDRAQTNETPNAFVRVITGGENYFYTEASLVNQWEQGLIYSVASPIVAYDIAQTIHYGKGIVWDFKNQEFNIFKNCKDFNAFIADKYPEGVQDCPKNQPNLDQVFQSIEKIK